MLDVTRGRSFRCTSISSLKGCARSGAFGGHRVSSILTLGLISIRTVGGTRFGIYMSTVGSMNNIVLPRLLSTLNMRCAFLGTRPANSFTRGPRPLRGGLNNVVSRLGGNNCSVNVIISPSISHLTFVYRSNGVFNRRCALMDMTSCMLDGAPNGAIDGLSSAHTLHSMARGRNNSCYTSTMKRIGMAAGVGSIRTIVNNRNGNKIVCPRDRCNHSTLMNVTLFLDDLTRGNYGMDRLHTDFPGCFVTGGHVSLATSASMSTVLIGMGRVCNGRGSMAIASVSNIGLSFPSG